MKVRCDNNNCMGSSMSIDTGAAKCLLCGGKLVPIATSLKDFLSSAMSSDSSLGSLDRDPDGD